MDTLLSTPPTPKRKKTTKKATTSFAGTAALVAMVAAGYLLTFFVGRNTHYKEESRYAVVKSGPTAPSTGVLTVSADHTILHLKRREFFAAAALQGILSQYRSDGGRMNEQVAADMATIYADALCKRLGDN